VVAGCASAGGWAAIGAAGWAWLGDAGGGLGATTAVEATVPGGCGAVAAAAGGGGRCATGTGATGAVRCQVSLRIVMLLFVVLVTLVIRSSSFFASASLSRTIAYAAMPWLPERPLRMLMYVAVVPLAVDGITQLIHLRVSNNTLRFETGVVAGLAFGLWVLSAIERPERNGLRSP